MTPSDVRSKLVVLQSDLRELEDVVFHQKSANVVYYEVHHEMVEAWDALERAIEKLDDAVMGIT